MIASGFKGAINGRDLCGWSSELLSVSRSEESVINRALPATGVGAVQFDLPSHRRLGDIDDFEHHLATPIVASGEGKKTIARRHNHVMNEFAVEKTLDGRR